MSEQAFPIRNLKAKIKQKKHSYSLKCAEQANDQTQREKEILLQEIKTCEEKLATQTLPYLLDLFTKIFDQTNYYIVYLCFVDKLRKFNEHHTHSLLSQNQAINNQILAKKLERQSIDNGTIDNVNKINEINKQISEKVKILTGNQQKLMLINIGIEIFWRELIEFQHHNPLQNLQKKSAADIVYQMIAKGEPFEFLNGDTLQIDNSFLKQLIQKFQNKGKERVLVFSVLGPQSSGKSTILNKIFGCHFWTSVGRCTKGIYLQILKVQNQDIHQNLFDHILLLDTEGLQSPNQKDHEFDKKIALFVLSISDVILINVKGDIHQQFKSLVEMCIFTLGELRNLSSIKQLSWCFNQNNDTTNKHPFMLQLDGISQNLQGQSLSEKDNIDYAEMLEAREENIKILGFSQNEIIWQRNQLTGVFTDWKQQKINHTYSEESYCYGINIIQRFIKKFKLTTNEEFQNLEYCFEKMSIDWQRIDRLPDLLEFSELVQHQQNLFMKKEFEGIISKFSSSYGQEINQSIQEQIGRRGQLVLDDFSQIKQIINREISARLDLEKQNMINILLATKNKHKISKKIFNKYEKMIKERIESSKLELQLYVQNSIKNYETDFQKRKGFQLLDEFVANLSQNPDQLIRLQQDDTLIENHFSTIWQKITENHSQSQNEMFLSSSESLFEVINQEFQSQAFISRKENEYKELIKNQISLIRPSLEDFNLIFEKFKIELQQNQFVIIEKNQSQSTIQLSEFFFRDITVKMEQQQSTDILPINYFFRYKITYYTIKEDKFRQYMQGEYLSDLSNLQRNRRFPQTTQDPHQFFSHMEMIGVEINQQDIENVIRLITNNTTRYGTRHFSCQVKIDFDVLNDDPDLLRYVQNYCKGLQVQTLTIYQDEKIQDQQFLNFQIENHSKILHYKIEIETKSTRLIQRFDESIFQYVKNPISFHHYQNTFRNNICTIIREYMKQDDYKAWKQLYQQIFEVIHSVSQNDLKNNIFEDRIDYDSRNLQYNAGLIRIIQSKIYELIKIFNQQLANFCVRLDVVGERCMFYFSMLIIWRIQCLSQYNFIQNNIQNLQSLRDEQFNKFKADIKQNRTEQSKIRGQALAQEIFNLKCDQLYIEYETQAINKIQLDFEIFQNSYQLIKHLDSIILEREEGQISDDDVLKYVRNQKNYIEDFINGKINAVKAKLQQEFTFQLGQDLRSHLQQVEHNSRNLQRFSLEVINAENYFVDSQDSNKNYPNLLFHIVQQCIQGNLDINYQRMIKPEYHDAFVQTGQKKFSAPIISDLQNQSDQEIQILKWFIEAFAEKIQEFIKNSHHLTFILEKLNIQTNLDEIKFRLVGCLETCPICKRKCDENPQDADHKHNCKSGHQLRGMNGVLIGNFPSLFTCEEIQDDFEIEVQETRIRRSWKDMKKIHSSWQFSFLDKGELQLHKDKIMKIWNNNIGQIICRCLSKELGQQVEYIPKNAVDPLKPLEVRHYIIMLDDSGSMQGQKWESIKTSSLRFLVDLEQQKNQLISVIIFNINARCVIFNQVPNFEAQKNLFVYNGGGTDFNVAFKLAIDRLTESFNLNKQIDKFFILFYTDGWAPYPVQAMRQFQNLPAELRRRIQITISTEEQESPVLQAIINDISSFIGSTELRKGIAPFQVQAVWLETITKRLNHQI